MILHKHNSETYANMVNLFQTEQRVASVQPTGTGKSYLIMQLIEDNADKRFAVCSPSTYIFEQMKSLAEENNIFLKTPTSSPTQSWRRQKSSTSMTTFYLTNSIGLGLKYGLLVFND